MSEDSAIIKCSHCGTKNRVPKTRLREHPKCGKCGEALQPEATIIKCHSCGAKNRILKALMYDQAKCGKCHVPLKTVPYYDYVVEVNDKTFIDEVLSFPTPVLVEFYSNSCPYCITLVPILRQLASEYSGQIKIAKLNIDTNPMTASRFQVMSTPTMIIFKDGKEINKLLGVMQKHEIEGHLRYVM